MTRWTLSLLGSLLVALLVASACESGGGGSATPPQDVAAGDTGAGSYDIVWGGNDTAVVGTDTRRTDARGDDVLVPPDGAGADTLISFDVPRPDPGELGAPCESSTDCIDPFCVDSDIGYICTRTCIDDCPEGWSCRGIRLGGPDQIFVCLPSLDRLCGEPGACRAGANEVEPCGNCGERTRSCAESCQWSPWSACSGEGPCRTGADERESCGQCASRGRVCTEACEWGAWSECDAGGVCSAGDIDTEACGDCGERSRTCTADCDWSDWGACASEGACAAGTITTEACGNCGTRTLVCGQDCAWGAPSACIGEGVCISGDVDEQACGKCGSQSRQCTASCAWTAWGACLGEGVCSLGQSTTEPCGHCGTATVDCTASCVWGPPGTCMGQGECGAGDSQPCQSCGTQVCTASCTWGACGGGPVDAYEENDTRAAARLVADISDSDGDASDLFANINPADDDDWFAVHVRDELGAVINPWARLTQVPTGHRYRFCVDYVCDDTDGTSVPPSCVNVDAGASEQIDIDAGSCDCGFWCTDNSGTLNIQIQPVGPGSCDSYHLEFGG